MTIIRPLKSKLSRYFIGIAAILVLFGGFYVYEHNQLTVLRDQISKAEKELLALQNRDSDLKNQLYSLTDSANLEKFAEERGLVLEKKPRYLNLNPSLQLSGLPPAKN